MATRRMVRLAMSPMPGYLMPVGLGGYGTDRITICGRHRRLATPFTFDQRNLPRLSGRVGGGRSGNGLERATRSADLFCDLWFPDHRDYVTGGLFPTLALKIFIVCDLRASGRC